MYLKCEGTLTQRSDAQWLYLVIEDGNTMYHYLQKKLESQKIFGDLLQKTLIIHFHWNSLPILLSFTIISSFYSHTEKKKKTETKS